jgi:Bacterial regulatory proteins, tetR family
MHAVLGRFSEVIAAAVRVFTREGYRAARMSDVTREAGLSEPARYPCVDSRAEVPSC